MANKKDTLGIKARRSMRRTYNYSYKTPAMKQPDTKASISETLAPTLTNEMKAWLADRGYQ